MLPEFLNGSSSPDLLGHYLLTVTTRFIHVNFQILSKLTGFYLVKEKNWHSSEAVYLWSFMAFHTNNTWSRNKKKGKKNNSIHIPLHPNNCHNPSCCHFSADPKLNKAKLKLLSGIQCICYTLKKQAVSLWWQQNMKAGISNSYFLLSGSRGKMRTPKLCNFDVP